MKRKGIILLSSILAGSLLVGGAFATYAVTDNADPFGINVTPGNIEEDTTTYVTLNWGEETNLEGVGLLKVGENRKVGVVSLASTQAYTGVFTVKIADQTENRDNKDYLFDHLIVSVYAGEQDLRKASASDPEPTLLPEGTPATTIAKGAVEGATKKEDRVKETSISAQGTATGTKYTVFVTLDSGAGSNFVFMNNDVVRLSVDWGAKAGDESTGKLVYFEKPSTWAKVYAYAWNGNTVNGDYPGVEMKPSYNEGLYEIVIPNAFASFQFNNGLSGEAEKKTDDLNFTGYNAATAPYWNGTAWAAKPDKEEVSLITATVDDEPITLTDVKDQDSENKAEFKITLAVGEVVVFKDGNTTIHYYHYDGKAIDDGTTFTAVSAGEHTFYYNQLDQMYVSQPATAINYYVVGTIQGQNKWSSSEYKLVPNTKSEVEEYMLETPITLAVDDGVKVMSVQGSAHTYFPEGSGNEFVITESEDFGAGTYQVYFRPAGNSAWGTPYYLTCVKQTTNN